MNIYTAFCQQACGGGTIWIDTVQAPDPVAAGPIAQAACADDWGYAVEDVHVLGIAPGSVEILWWDDLGDD
jgi:hypothetical protein